MKLRMIRRCAARGFTLIELLLVLVILTALASVVVPMYVHRGTDAKIVEAKTDISHIGAALSTFEVDNGRYPTSAEGLGALSIAPGELTNWHGPYVQKAVRNDPWGNPYVYACPGTHNTDGYDLHCLGPSGQDGAADNITNWTAE